MSIFFTSDLHLGHRNVIGFGRPQFANIDDHDECLIAGWNSRVNKRDKVFVLGDVAFGLSHLSLVAELKGTKELIIGNHDQQATIEYLKYFTKVHGCRKYKDFILTHCPVHPSEMEYRWKFNLYGHIHESHKVIKDARYFCVGVDHHDFMPISLDEVKTKLALKGMGY